MTIEQRLQNIENRLSSLQISMVQMQKNQTPITAKADTSSSKVPQIDANTNGVSENDQAICEVAELEDTDSQAIDELAEMVDTNSTAIDDLAELVDELLQEINDLKGGQ